MREWLIKLLIWCLSKLGVEVFRFDAGLAELAREAVEFAAANYPRNTGAFKHAQAMIYLIKHTRGVRRRDMALAVEHAFRKFDARRVSAHSVSSATM